MKLLYISLTFLILFSVAQCEIDIKEKIKEYGSKLLDKIKARFDRTIPNTKPLLVLGSKIVDKNPRIIENTKPLVIQGPAINRPKRTIPNTKPLVVVNAQVVKNPRIMESTKPLLTSGHVVNIAKRSPVRHALRVNLADFDSLCKDKVKISTEKVELQIAPFNGLYVKCDNLGRASIEECKPGLYFVDGKGCVYIN